MITTQPLWTINQGITGQATVTIWRKLTNAEADRINDSLQPGIWVERYRGKWYLVGSDGMHPLRVKQPATAKGY